MYNSYKIFRLCGYTKDSNIYKNIKYKYYININIILIYKYYINIYSVNLV